ncbi:MAG: hypothetical protein BGO68_01340 [Candidatus Amoebophilus sp. 36-38]|nr:MAG: hypothetical protein BGO68_01340 [Candidatus Amoebophilus sp. 36-38]
MNSHLGALREGNANYEIAAKPFLQNDRDHEEAIKLAIGLQSILEEKQIQIDLNEVPQEPNYIDPTSKSHLYRLTESLPEVYLVKVHNQWIYSEATVAYIKNFYEKNSFLKGKSPLQGILKYVYRKGLFEIHGWQLMMLVCSLLLGIALYKLLHFILHRYCQFLAKSEGYKEITNLIRPINLFIISFLVRFLITFLKLPKLVEEGLLIYWRGFLFFIGMLLSYHLVDLFTFYIRKQTLENKLNFNLVLLPMLKVSLRVIVVIVGVIVTLQSFGFDVKGLLAGVGIGGLGFALASQDTIKNFFGSLVILTDKPFNIGDYINSENVDGKVEEIGFRSTRIRTNQGSSIYVPNGKLADSYIDNYGLKQYKQFKTHIPIACTTPIPLIEIFIEGLRKISERCPASREGKYYIYLYDLKKAIFYIRFELNFDVTDYNSELANRHDILMKIIKLAKALDIEFAFPTHTLHVENFDKKKTHLVDSDTELTDLKERLQAFLNENSSIINT